MKKAYLNLLKFIIGIGIFILLFYKVGAVQIGKLLIQFNFWYLPIILLTLITTLFLQALNIKILLNKIHKINFLKLFKYYLLSWSFGLFIPGKIGQFSIVALFKKNNINFGYSTAIILLDKIITLATLSILALIGFAFFFSFKQTIIIFLMLVIIGIIGLFTLHSTGRKLIKKYILRKYAHKFQGFAKTLRFYITKCKKQIILNLFFTFIKWLVSAAVIYYIFMSFNYNINFWIVFLITPMGTLSSFIPISLSGLGVRESTVAFVYNLISVDAITVVSVYIVSLIINYILALVCISFFLEEFNN
tara:strand:+ start:1313 stop:2224 length:912 start_codon:yes stop_codon:yes gene_type:complete